MYRSLLALLFFLLPLDAGTKPFIVGKLHDRFGNQLFEIAATLSLALDHKAEALFPDLKLRKDEGIPLNYEMVFFRLNSTYPKEKIDFHYKQPLDFHFEKPKFVPNMMLTGYFHSEKYFKHNKEKILPLFEPKPEIYAYIKKKYPYLSQHPQTVAIHLRDYDKELGPHNQIFAKVGRHYIERAVALFPEEAVFLVFSDRIDWAKWVLKDFFRPLIFIEGNNYLQDFFFMSHCQHQIITNSTFSWWAAYLNKNPDKRVVAPGNWFVSGYPATSEHIIPPEWIVLYPESCSD